MASAVLTTFTSTSAAVVGDVAHAILKSSDWTRIQRGSDINTTLSASILAGVTAFTSAATIPAGSIITLSGTETVQSTAVSGAGPFTITIAGATKLAHTSGDAIATGSLFGATTTRGAQLRVDIADSLPGANSYRFFGLGVYRSHDGTTAVDKITRYCMWRTTINNGVAAEITHCDVSVSKEHVYIGVSGALPGENSTAVLDNSVAGQPRWSFYLGDVVPYNVTDAVPCVACVATSSTTTSYDHTVSVSRDRNNTTSWVSARLASIMPIVGPGISSGSGPLASAVKLKNASDGTTQLLPFSVWELTDGLRGRLNGVYFQGIYSAQSTAISTDEVPGLGTVIGPVSGVTYTTIELVRVTASAAGQGTGFGILYGLSSVAYTIGAVASG